VHQRIDTLKPTDDVWEFHEQGDRREVPSVLSFWNYATSPTTEKVTFTPPVPVEDGYEGEVRAYGPEGQIAWFNLAYPLTPHVYGNLEILFWRLMVQGKLKRA